MSKYIKVEDIKNALIELSKSGKWLGRETTMNIIEALGNLRTIDIVHCKDCIRFDGEDCCERIGMILYPEDVERHFCGYGERKDNE